MLHNILARALQVKLQTSPHAQAVDGVEPGTMVLLASSDVVNVTLTYATTDSLLRALAWWRNATSASADHSALYRHAAAADAALVLTEVHNKTGEPLQMWMDLGTRTTVADVTAGTQRVTQPLVRPTPRTQGAAVAPHPPAMLLCLTLQTLQLQVRCCCAAGWAGGASAFGKRCGGLMLQAFPAESCASADLVRVYPLQLVRCPGTSAVPLQVVRCTAWFTPYMVWDGARAGGCQAQRNDAAAVHDSAAGVRELV